MQIIEGLAAPQSLEGQDGEDPIVVPRAWDGSFEPELIRKGQTLIDGRDGKSIVPAVQCFSSRPILPWNQASLRDVDDWSSPIGGVSIPELDELLNQRFSNRPCPSFGRKPTAPLVRAPRSHRNGDQGDWDWSDQYGA
tara:strand:+ start:162 stop:575 length:414 start_codon:yes stop_codon:yes gene_type:complete